MIYRTSLYHLVHNSPWPFVTSLILYMLVISLLGLKFSNLFFCLGLLVLAMFGFWFRDICREQTYCGFYFSNSMVNLSMGMILFITSEVMFFFAFFWSFFHFSLSPSVELGCSFPPMSVTALNPLTVPFLNTVILLSSSVTITCSHHSIIVSNYLNSLVFLFVSIVLSVLFLVCQGFEYYNLPFTISSSSYGTVFFVLTGFHSTHVLVGVIFLFSMMLRMVWGHFTSNHHLSFEFSIWYWHFVDVVWLFLFIVVYSWVIIFRFSLMGKMLIL